MWENEGGEWAQKSQTNSLMGKSEKPSLGPGLDEDAHNIQL